MSESTLEFLPNIPEMPTPPKDSGDVEAWEKHIAAIDKFLLDLNEAILKTENNDYAKKLQQAMEDRGIDLEKVSFPQEMMLEVSEKINAVLEKLGELDYRMDGEQTMLSRPKKGIIKKKRNISAV